MLQRGAITTKKRKVKELREKKKGREEGRAVSLQSERKMRSKGVVYVYYMYIYIHINLAAPPLSPSDRSLYIYI